MLNTNKIVENKNYKMNLSDFVTFHSNYLHVKQKRKTKR